MSTDILLFVEDPGAANWIAALHPALIAAGLGVRLVAAGAAKPYLFERGIAAEAAPAGAAADAAGELIDRARPRMAIVGTSENLDTLGLAIIAEARQRGVLSLSFVDQAVNAEHRFRGRSRDPLAFAPDILLLPNETARQAFAGLGLPAQRLIVTGDPHHDRVLAAARSLAREGRTAVRARVLPELPADRPLIVFLSEIGYVVNPEGGDWERQFGLAGRGPSFARGKATYRTAIVLEELLDALSGLAPRPLLVVRLHPKNARGEFAAYEGEVDAFSAGGDPLPLVFAADLVVGIATALLEEAHIMGRPALSILPRAEERDWLEGLRDGRITSVTARSELRPALVRALHDRSDRAAKHTYVEDARARTVRWISRQLLAEPVHG